MKANELSKHVKYMRKIVKGNSTLPALDCLLINDDMLLMPVMRQE